MVFKPIANFARHGIAKHIVTGGYAQGVIAASQQLPIIKSNVPTKLTNHFGGAGAGKAQTTGKSSTTDALNSYYSSHGQLLDEGIDKDTKRYLFSKKILWSKAQHQTKDLSLLEGPASEQDGKYSSQEVVDTEGATDLHLSSVKPDQPLLEETSSDSRPILEETQVQHPADQFNSSLEKLKCQGRFKDILLQVQQALDTGLSPNTETFNYYLTAVAQLIRFGVLDNRVSHLMSVYAQMMNRKLIPSTKTYAILLTSLVKCAKNKDAVIEQKRKQAMRFGFVVPSQPELLGAEIDTDDGVTIALDLFDASNYVEHKVHHLDVYSSLIDICSSRGMTDAMINVYTQMEKSGVKPTAEIYWALLSGFGKAQDVHSSLEVYDQVKSSIEENGSATAFDNARVYRHLLSAFVSAGEVEKAFTLFDAVEPQHRGDSLEHIIEGIVDGFLKRKDFQSASQWIDRFSSDAPYYGYRWSIAMLANASDADNFPMAQRAFQDSQKYLKLVQEESHGEGRSAEVLPKADEIIDAKNAFLGLCERKFKPDSARAVWADMDIATVGLAPAFSYVKLLLTAGQVDDALQGLSQFLSKSSARTTSQPSQWALDAAWRHLISNLSARHVLTAEVAASIWGIGAFHATSNTIPLDCIRSLFAASMMDSTTMTTEEHYNYRIHLIASALNLDNRSELAKLQSIVGLAMKLGLRFEEKTKESVQMLINSAESRLHPSFVGNWVAYIAMQENRPFNVAEYDPYSTRFNHRLSNVLEEMMDRKRHIADVMKSFRHGIRDKQLVRYQTFGKLIDYACRNKNRNACDEVFHTALQEIKMLHMYDTVRSGWYTIYDNMIAACLNFGDMEMANRYRSELFNMGGIPSANTFGLFIVNLRQSAEIFDEASEAVALFDQAVSLNVQPTAFLYNAVIGKLAKARRVDDCLKLYSDMCEKGLKPTSVTYGTMINALCRVSDERSAELLFTEMEAQPNYKPKAAPYNSMIQFYATTKRDRSKVLAYYNQMLATGIEPTSHTYKLLIDAYASLDPPDIAGAEGVIAMMHQKCTPVDCTHHAALIHARGCALQDPEGALEYFHRVVDNKGLKLEAPIYQALFEMMVANHRVTETPKYLEHMYQNRVTITPYIANTLIHGYTMLKDIAMAQSIYNTLDAHDGSVTRREPSTYEAMTRAYLAVEDRQGALAVMQEMSTRGYPPAVMQRVYDLVRGGGQLSVAV